jgi:homoserine kinase type II
MAIYHRLDRREVEGLARRFGIDEITAFTLMGGGNENTSYIIESKSARYVLTLMDQKSLEHATNLATLLVHLTDQGIRTSRVVLPPKGPIVLLHDEKPVMMKRYVDGDVRSDLPGDLLVQLGEELARLHEIPAPSYVPQAFPYGRSHFHEVTNSKLGHEYIDWLSEKVNYLQKHIPQDLPTITIPRSKLR